MDPWNHLASAADGTTGKEACGKRHKWKKPAVRIQYNRIAGHDAADTERFNRQRGRLPCHREVGQKIAAGRRRLIGGGGTRWAIMIDARYLDEDPRSVLRV